MSFAIIPRLLDLQIICGDCRPRYRFLGTRCRIKPLSLGIWSFTQQPSQHTIEPSLLQSLPAHVLQIVVIDILQVGHTLHPKLLQGLCELLKFRILQERMHRRFHELESWLLFHVQGRKGYSEQCWLDMSFHNCDAHAFQ